MATNGLARKVSGLDEFGDITHSMSKMKTINLDTLQVPNWLRDALKLLDMDGEGLSEDHIQEVIHAAALQKQLDTNSDGEIFYRNFPVAVQKVMEIWDVDGSGTISHTELAAAAAAQKKLEQEKNVLLRAVYGLTVLVVILAVLNFVMGYAAAEAAKDYRPSLELDAIKAAEQAEKTGVVDNGNVLKTGNSQPIKVEKATPTVEGYHHVVNLVKKLEAKDLAAADFNICWPIEGNLRCDWKCGSMHTKNANELGEECTGFVSCNGIDELHICQVCPPTPAGQAGIATPWSATNPCTTKVKHLKKTQKINADQTIGIQTKITVLPKPDLTAEACKIKRDEAGNAVIDTRRRRLQGTELKCVPSHGITASGIKYDGYECKYDQDCFTVFGGKYECKFATAAEETALTGGKCVENWMKITEEDIAKVQGGR